MRHDRATAEQAHIQAGDDADGPADGQATVAGASAEGVSAEGGYFGDAAATLGDRIAAARQAAGLSQAGLAARLGAASDDVEGWEIDRAEPRANSLATLAGLLGVSVSWLLSGAGEGVEPPEGGASAQRSAARLRLSLGVDDLAVARRFYADVLGCSASADGAEVDFFGHRLALLVAPVEPSAPTRGDAADGAVVRRFAVDAEGAPTPRVGVALNWDTWRALVDRLRVEGVEFLVEPTIRDVGAPSEEGGCVVADPCGNALEFLAYGHPDHAMRPNGDAPA